jgi:CxxC-x17-CxxC domain-containing protein
MSDRTLTCRDCGQTFTFTAGEQAFYTERGFSDPQRCPACRAAKKAQRGAGGFDSAGAGDGGYERRSYGGGSGGPRQMYPAICSSCGRSTEVPFLPRNEKPVYCRECFQEQRGNQPRYSSY